MAKSRPLIFRYFLLLFFLASYSICYAQNSKIEKKTKKYFTTANEYYRKNDPRNALLWLDKTIEVDSSFYRAYYLKSDIFNFAGDFVAEEKVYLTLLRHVPNDLKAHLNLADLYLKNGRYQKAFNKYTWLSTWPELPERFVENVKNNLISATNAMKLFQHPEKITLERLPEPVNSIHDEYWPCLNPSKDKLFFTRTHLYNGAGSRLRHLEENLYYDELKDGQWQKPIFLDSINTDENEGAASFSQDANTIYFTACNRPGFQGDCNIYYAKYENGVWGSAHMLPPPINSPYKETQPSISYDGNTLYFSSDRPGGKGGMDIWKSTKLENGKWSIPRNLNSRVNTKMNEESPFIHADNSTLYFASNGHPGLGRSDLFIVNLLDSAPPLNLGYPLNDHNKQIGIYVSSDGISGFYATADTAGKTGLDIYRFELPVAFRPKQVEILKGRIVNKKTKKPVQCNLVVFKSSKVDQPFNNQSDKDGNFYFSLPMETEWGIVINHHGFMPFSAHIGVSQVAKDTIYTFEIEPLEPYGQFNLFNIFFDFDSDSLKLESKTEIETLTDFLKTNPEIIIEIGGHTDNKGSDAYNLELSERRAVSLKKALVAASENHAETRKRIKTKGYGASHPIASNETEAGRQRNRRTQITILTRE